jgi:hypothetical protein
VVFELAKLSSVFWKGTAVIICAFILFVGSVYILLSAVFGLRMGYLVLAVSFFGWMIILSACGRSARPGRRGTSAPGIRAALGGRRRGPGQRVVEVPEDRDFPGPPLARSRRGGHAVGRQREGR